MCKKTSIIKTQRETIERLMQTIELQKQTMARQHNRIYLQGYRAGLKRHERKTVRLIDANLPPILRDQAA